MKWYYYIPGVAGAVNRYWERRCEREILRSWRRDLSHTCGAARYPDGLILPIVEANVRIGEACNILQDAVDGYARSLADRKIIQSLTSTEIWKQRQCPSK